MNKPKHLRQYLLSSIPELPQDQDRLRIVADQGTMSCVMGKGYSLEMSYKLEILLTECTINPEIIGLVLFTWVQQHQPELMANLNKAKDAISFESEIIDNDKSDLYFSMNLTERVIVKPNAAGKFEFSYPEEPSYTKFDEPTNFEVIDSQTKQVLATWPTIKKEGWSLDMPFPGRNP